MLDAPGPDAGGVAGALAAVNPKSSNVTPVVTAEICAAYPLAGAMVASLAAL
jgi:hypothetical protein